MKIDGITVVSPMYGDRVKTDRMIFSVLHQYINEKNPFKIHLVLVDDYIEKRDDKNNSYYDYYLSEEFKNFYNEENIKISLIKNDTHKYQGESREIGFLAGDYNWFLLIDCDDMLSPNACDRYISILRNYYEKEDHLDVSCIFGYLYGFGSDGYEQKVKGDSIWVQARCYNRQFIIDNDIHFPTGMNSKCGEDYPFIRKLDYVLNHNSDKYETLTLPFDDPDDNCQCTAYWFPNEESLSRNDPYYPQHLSGWTMASSNNILDFFEEYNKKHNLEDEEDEYMKHEVLNMVIYSFYNLLDFIKIVSMTEYEPIKDDWDELRKQVSKLRNRLKEKYWDEIVYSDVEDMLYNIKHFSDCHFTESWIGTFYDYVNKGTNILDMEYDEMMKYAKEELEFDGAHHEIHSPQVIAWGKRHKKNDI